MPESDIGTHEVQQLRRCMRDLVALSAFPAVWIGYDAQVGSPRAWPMCCGTCCTWTSSIWPSGTGPTGSPPRSLTTPGARFRKIESGKSAGCWSRG